MEVIIWTILLIAIALISNAISFYFTEVRKPIYDVKPLNCYGCLSFWLTVILGFSAAYFSPKFPNFGSFAVVLAYCNFLYVKFKYKVYE